MVYPARGNGEAVHDPTGAPHLSSRRSFLRKLTGSLAVAAAVGGCDAVLDLRPGGLTAAVNLGSGDIGILNYAYALEQLEAAFYTQVVSTPFAGITDEEMRVLTDLRDHEIIHREFFAAAIPALGGTAIPSLAVNFSRVRFNDRMSVLETARTFEDLGVAAYNGAGQLISNADVLLVAGKIVSVEARHAAAIRDLIRPRSTFFAGDDVVDENGLDRAMTPRAVLAAADPFIVNQIDASNLPTT